VKMRNYIALLLSFLLALSICGCQKADEENAASTEVAETENSYEQIGPEEAKRLMDTEDGYIILDVREQDEFDEQHIPGAILMPYTKAEELAPELLPSKSQLILIYCRSGRRSKIAAEALANMGYTNIKEFGGIIDWPYETDTLKGRLQ